MLERHGKQHKHIDEGYGFDMPPSFSDRMHTDRLHVIVSVHHVLSLWAHQAQAQAQAVLRGGMKRKEGDTVY